MKATGGKSNLHWATLEEVVMLLHSEAGAELLLLQALIGMMGVYREGLLRTQLVTAWNQLQEEVSLEPVVAVSEVSEVCEAVVASTTKGRGVRRPSVLGSESLPSAVGALAEGAKEIRHQISR